MSDKPVYFWRESDTTGYFSQWYDCPFRDDEDPSKIYPTAEHYMMHHKALLFNDTHIASEILTAKHPKKVKALGRAVSNFSESKWEEKRLEIVIKGNMLKFTNAVTEEGFRLGTSESKSKTLPLISETKAGSLKGLILETGERLLVEASPYDRIWGIGYAKADAERCKETWGENLLGVALMEVRGKLREQAA